MSAPPYMAFYVGDYLADTTHLTTTEHGAYMLLLMAMWRTGGTLPSDDRNLARFARCTIGQWRRMRPVIMAFFEIEGDLLTHARLSAERTKYTYAVERQRVRSSNGGKAKALKYQEAIAAAGTPQARQPEPEPEPDKNLVAKGDDAAPATPPTKSPAKEYHPQFEAAWKAYPHAKGRGSKKKSEPQWKAAAKAVGSATRLHDAIVKFAKEGREPRADCGAKAMELWLGDGLYEHWLAAAPNTAPAAPLVPVDAQLHQKHLERFRATGVWYEQWGPEPILPTPDQLLQRAA